MQTTNQPVNCSPPPGTYRSGAMISQLLGFMPAIKLDGHEAVGNMKLFNNHSGSIQFSSRGLASPASSREFTGRRLFLRTPFTEGCTEGCTGAIKKASPPGRQQRYTFRATMFSSVQSKVQSNNEKRPNKPKKEKKKKKKSSAKASRCSTAREQAGYLLLENCGPRKFPLPCPPKPI